VLVQYLSYLHKIKILKMGLKQCYVAFEGVAVEDTWIDIDQIFMALPSRATQNKRLARPKSKRYPFRFCMRFAEGKAFMGTAKGWDEATQTHRVMFDDQSMDNVALPQPEIDVVDDDAPAVTWCGTELNLLSKPEGPESWEKDEKALVFWGPRLYFSRIVDIKPGHQTRTREGESEETPVLVHFQGWGHKHRKWCSYDHVCKLTPDNLLYQQELEGKFQNVMGPGSKGPAAKRGLNAHTAVSMTPTSAQQQRYMESPITTYLSEVAASFGWAFGEVVNPGPSVIQHMSNLSRRGDTEYSPEYIEQAASAGKTYGLWTRQGVLVSFCCVSKWKCVPLPVASQ
jgi:hypothetical protein